MSGFLSSIEYSYNTKSVANLRLPFYTLSIRAPGGSLLPVQSYTFPLPPQQYKKEAAPLNTVYDTQGSPAQAGVQRSVDQFGQALPYLSISGTTGWKLHSADGYIFSGTDSVIRIQEILNRFAVLNQGKQQAQQSDLYVLEFYDFFMNDFFQVVPIGAIGIQQSAQQPLNAYYQFRFAVTANIAFGIEQLADAVLGRLFGTGILTGIGLAVGAGGAVSSVLANY